MTVRESQSRRSHRASALELDTSSHARRESGYFSPESRSRSRTPDNFLESNQEQVRPRTLGLETSSRHFQQIRDEVFDD